LLPDISCFRFRQHHFLALALQDSAYTAFKKPSATRASYGFMTWHAVNVGILEWMHDDYFVIHSQNR
jgi:hypothetical protein